MVYDFDLTSTLMALMGIEPAQKMDGINLWPIATPGGAKRETT